MVDAAEELSVIYIAGYGRSGSTVLDVLLGSHERAVSVGELVYLGDEWMHKDRMCACGMSYRNCPFWAEVLRGPREAMELTRAARQVETRRALPCLITGTLPLEHRRSYRNRMRHLFASIADRGGANLIVDSSKSARHAAGRFWALRNIAGLDVRVLHLVRDGRDVLNSVIEKGTNWAAEGYQEEKAYRAERTLAGWEIANCLAWALGMSLGEDRYFRVHFEDLLSKPKSVLSNIEAFAGIDLSSIMEKVAARQSFSIGHNVGGNRLRHKKRLRLRLKRKEDRRPWSQLGLYHKVLFGIFGQWLNIALR